MGYKMKGFSGFKSSPVKQHEFKKAFRTAKGYKKNSPDVNKKENIYSHVEESSQKTKDYFEGVPKKTTTMQKLRALGKTVTSGESYTKSKAGVRGDDYRRGKKRPSPGELAAYSKEQGTYRGLDGGLRSR